MTNKEFLKQLRNLGAKGLICRHTKRPFAPCLSQKLCMFVFLLFLPSTFFPLGSGNESSPKLVCTTWWSEYHPAPELEPIKCFGGFSYGKVVVIQSGDACEQRFWLKYFSNVVIREVEDISISQLTCGIALNQVYGTGTPLPLFGRSGAQSA